MITRYDVYVGGQFSCEYEVHPVFHEKNSVPVKRGYYCIRRVVLNRFNTFINVWGFFDPVVAVWRATSDEAIRLAEFIIDKEDFAVGYNAWRDSQRAWCVDPSVSVDCELALLDAITAIPCKWRQRQDRVNVQVAKSSH